MDAVTAKWKLKYVTELLTDVAHFQQASTHTCSCDLCIRKQTLVQVSIAKALEEISCVYQTFDTGQEGKASFAQKQETDYALANSNCSFRSSLGKAATEESSKSKEDSFSVTSSDSDGHSGQSENLKGHARIEPRRMTDLSKAQSKVMASMLSASLKDSGVYNSVASESVSHISCEGDLNNKIDSVGQHYADTRTADDLAASYTNLTHHKSPLKQLNLPSTEMSSKPVLSHRNKAAAKISQNADTSCSHISPCCQHVSGNSPQEVKQSSRSRFDLSEISAQRQLLPDMMISFPVLSMLSTTQVAEEVEKYRRYSEEITRNPGLLDTDIPKLRHQSFPHLPSLTSSPYRSAGADEISEKSQLDSNMINNFHTMNEKSDIDSGQIISTANKNSSVVVETHEKATPRNKSWQRSHKLDSWQSFFREPNNQPALASHGNKHPTLSDKVSQAWHHNSFSEQTSMASNKDSKYRQTAITEVPTSCSALEESYVDQLFLQDLRQKLMELNMKGETNSSAMRKHNSETSFTSRGQPVNLKSLTKNTETEGSTLTGELLPSVKEVSSDLRKCEQLENHQQEDSNHLVCSLSTSVWRPWQPKDDILGLMSIDTEEDLELSGGIMTVSNEMTEVKTVEDQYISVRGRNGAEEVNSEGCYGEGIQTKIKNEGCCDLAMTKNMTVETQKKLGSLRIEAVDRNSDGFDFKTAEKGKQSSLSRSNCRYVSDDEVKVAGQDNTNKDKQKHRKDETKNSARNVQTEMKTDQELGSAEVTEHTQQGESSHRDTKDAHDLRGMQHTPQQDNQDEAEGDKSTPEDRLGPLHFSSADRFVNKRRRLSPKMGMSSTSVPDLVCRSDRRRSLGRPAQGSFSLSDSHSGYEQTQKLWPEGKEKSSEIVHTGLKSKDSLPVSQDTSLKCMSNLDKSPRRDRRSALLGQSSLPGMSKLSSVVGLTDDKENEDSEVTEILKKVNISSSRPRSMGGERSLGNTRETTASPTPDIQTEGQEWRTMCSSEKLTHESDISTKSSTPQFSASHSAGVTPDRSKSSETNDSPSSSPRQVPSVVISSPGEHLNGSADDEEDPAKGITPQALPGVSVPWGTPAILADYYLDTQSALKSDTNDCGTENQDFNKNNKYGQKINKNRKENVKCRDSQAKDMDNDSAHRPKALPPSAISPACRAALPKSKANLDSVHSSDKVTDQHLSNEKTRDCAINSSVRAEIKSSSRTLLDVAKQEKVNLNLSLPAAYYSSPGSSGDITAGKPTNESFEANQSFPKMVKPGQRAEGEVQDAQTVTVAAQDLVTDLHQIATETTSEPAPRNRRSIYGFSPPDDHLDEQVKARRVSVLGIANSSCNQVPGGKEDSDEVGYMDTLWSALDATDIIGQGPTAQEVLFNCVTSSVCVVDPQRNGKIISVNESFQFLIGLHEKVIGQRLFRFLKVRDDLRDLSSSIPQSFVLADGQHSTVSGKLLRCVDDRGEEVPVSVWTVPYSPRPQLILCVIDTTTVVSADVYLNRQGNVLMYSEQLEGILGLPGEKTRDSAEGVCQISGLDFTKVGTAQQRVVQAKDGSSVPVTVTLTQNEGGGDCVGDGDREGGISDSTIFPATVSVAANTVGLITTDSDSHIQAWDQNFFRIHLGHLSLQRKNLSELLSRIVKIGQTSTHSSLNGSPADQRKCADKTLADVSRLQGGRQLSEGSVKEDVKDCNALHLPKMCFVPHLDETDDGDDVESDDNGGIDDDEEEEERQTSFSLHVGQAGPVPHQTSTPCKAGHPRQLAGASGITDRELDCTKLDSGIYEAIFTHGNEDQIPITFKLSRIHTAQRGWIFCLWVYIQTAAQPCENRDDDDAEEEEEDEIDSLEANEEEDEEDEDVNRTADQGELRKGLRHLHLDQSLDKTVEPSLGRLIMEQAGLNQSHNATSEADILDLEAAIDGSFSRKYVVCEALGQGSFGFVRRAQLVNSTETAVVKFIKKSKMFDDSWIVDEHHMGKRLPLEVAILREIDCPYIIQLMDVHENPKFVQMVMEDFGHTDLFDLIDLATIDEPLACFIFRQILWAMEYLHKRGIIHRDIKDENVIVNQDFHCKLIDFGSAAYMLPEGELFTKFRGTMEYYSPEVHQGECYRGPELDMWALGVTLYTIVFRENPFTATETPCQLTEADLPSPISSDLENLLLGLLKANPRKRWTMQRAVASEWLRQIVDMGQYDWQDMLGDGQEVASLDDEVVVY